MSAPPSDMKLASYTGENSKLENDAGSGMKNYFE